MENRKKVEIFGTQFYLKEYVDDELILNFEVLPLYKKGKRPDITDVIAWIIYYV